MLFPDFSKLKRKPKLEGQAFTVLVTGVGMGPHDRNLDVRDEAWEMCVACPDYRTCYDLSLAKLMMNHILMNINWAHPWVGTPQLSLPDSV